MTMKELDYGEKRTLNRFDGARALMAEWGDPQALRNRVRYPLRKSTSGNINDTGSVGELPARILTPTHPHFERFVEEGVRALVVVLVRRHGLITYTSCEGHHYPEGGPTSSERHVGLLPRSQAEYDAMERAFIVAGRDVNALALTPHVRIALLRHTLDAGDEALPALDLYLARNKDSSWSDYFASVGPICEAITSALGAAEPIA
jgi:uncharacterized protein